MSVLILIRHSISQPDPATSAHSWQLTSAGENRITLLAERLRPYRIDKIYTSVEPKACSTGELLGNAYHMDFEIAPDLHETRRETAPFYNDIHDFQHHIQRAMAQPDEVIFGEESFAAALARFEKQISQLLAFHPHQNLGVVTHGTIMSLFIGHHTSLEPFDVWQSLDMPAYAVFSQPDCALIDLVPQLA